MVQTFPNFSFSAHSSYFLPLLQNFVIYVTDIPKSHRSMKKDRTGFPVGPSLDLMPQSAAAPRFFTRYVKAGWCPIACLCRPLASHDGGVTSSHEPGFHFMKCG